MESAAGKCNACTSGRFERSPKYAPSYAAMKREEEAAAAIAEEAEISRLVEVGVERIRTEPSVKAENLEKLRAYVAGGTDPSRREVCRRVLKRVEGL